LDLAHEELSHVHRQWQYESGSFDPKGFAGELIGPDVMKGPLNHGYFPAAPNVKNIDEIVTIDPVRRENVPGIIGAIQLISAK